MSKRFRGLGKIVRIFNPPSRGRGHPTNSKNDRGLKLEGSLKHLIPHLVSLEEGFQILDRDFPIREGRGRIDLVACNSAGELILIWVVDALEPERLFRLIPEYDWAQKNSSLWKHLFIPIRRKEALPFQVWLVAREVDPQIPSALSYLKGIRMKIIHLQRVKQGSSWAFLVRPWKETNTDPSPDFQGPFPIPASLDSPPPPAKPVRSPTLTPAEIKDLMTDGTEDGVNYEDEITDPYCPLSELK